MNGMIFKALSLYRLRKGWKITLEQLQAQLARTPFQRCPANEPKSRGWISPRGDGGLVYALDRQWMITLATEVRLVPGHVITRTVQELAEQIEAQQGYKPGRRQLRDLREKVAEELLPKAFTRITRTRVWIDREGGWLAIDTSSPARAEEVIEQLRLSLDDFPVDLLHTRLSPTSAMADWLAGEPPAEFSLGRDCELKAVGEQKAAVRYVRHTLEGKEIKEHLANGFLPTRLDLSWGDRIAFVLTDRLWIKRLTVLDLLVEQAEKERETADTAFDADFALMTGELRRFLPALVGALGGEAA